MRYLVLDIETTGLDWKKDFIHGVALCDPNGKTSYVIPETPGWDWLLSAIDNPSIAKVGHNLRFDLRFLGKWQRIQGQLWDTMLMGQLVDENNSVGLKQLAERYLGKDAVSNKAELDRRMAHAGAKHVGELCRLDLESEEAPHFEIIKKYALEDVENTYKLFNLLGKKLKAIDQNWRTAKNAISTPLDYLINEASKVEPALLAMELRGITLNPAAISQSQEQTKAALTEVENCIYDLCGEEIDLIEEKLYEKEVRKRKSEKGKARVQRSSSDYSTEFLLSSSQHIGLLLRILAGTKDLATTSSGLYSTSDEHLSKLRTNCEEASNLAKFLDCFANYRKLQKLWTTYVGPESGLLEHASDGKVHSLYLQAGSSKDGGKGGTATGRLSSQSPNMQNLPRNGNIKRFFVPDPGHVFVYADYSQVELRIAAHLSKDEELINAYANNLDLHSITAASIFSKPISEVKKEERQVGKTLNFAMIYDASAWRLEQELGPIGYSLEDCDAMRRAFFEKYEGYDMYLKRELGKLKDNKVVISETGRVRRLPDVNYGTCLEWRGKVFKGTEEQYQALKNHPGEHLSNSEAFERAKKRYRHAIKQAYNFPIQSLGASITKRALIALHSKGYDLVTTVHDSIVVQVRLEDAMDAKMDIQRILENNYKLSVPLIAETKLLTSLEESDILSIGDKQCEYKNQSEKLNASSEQLKTALPA